MRDVVRAIVCLAAFALPLFAAERKSGTIAVTGDGRFVLTANPDSRSVSIVDAGQRTVVAEVKVNGTPQTVCVAPDDARAYVPTREGSLAVIDLSPPRLVQSIGIGGELFGAVCDGARLYVSAAACRA